MYIYCIYILRNGTVASTIRSLTNELRTRDVLLAKVPVHVYFYCRV